MSSATRVSDESAANAAARDVLSTALCGIALRNPVIAASGTFGYGIEFAHLCDLSELGAIVTKGLSREPIAGNPAPRLWHTEAGMINSVGLQNVGVRVFIREKLPKLRAFDVPAIVNVFGYSLEDYIEVLKQLEDAEGLAAYELNVSCPNTKAGGIFFSSEPSLTAQVVSRARAVVSKRPLIVKLSPNVARIAPFATAAEGAGADAISLVNTVTALTADIASRKSRIGAGFGGLSGPAIRPVALRMVYEASRAVSIPAIGLGGIFSGEHAAEFLMAGASAIQVGTASFVDPCAPIKIAGQLRQIVIRSGARRVGELVRILRIPGAEDPKD
ncbi:MAG: dihydroorotate dehydrogenase [Acidobacteriaceae bacterium]|nr:dihydroorotate dehydrogenase [Acidobacteriaceae bacterium]